jgi:hypothetical protein
MNPETLELRGYLQMLREAYHREEANRADTLELQVERWLGDFDGFRVSLYSVGTGYSEVHDVAYTEDRPYSFYKDKLVPLYRGFVSAMKLLGHI